MKDRFCVECRWCDLQFVPPGGSRFVCQADGSVLPSDVVSRPSCARFQPMTPQGHWGP